MLILVVNGLAVAASVATAFLVRIDSQDLARFGVLVGCVWAVMELTRHTERRRSSAHRTHVAYIDTTTVWTFAAILVLPSALASATVIVVMLLMWYRIKRRKVLPYRHVYSVATTLLGTQAAILVLRGGMHSYPGVPNSTFAVNLADLGVIIAAGILLWAFNYGLIVAAIALFNPALQTKDLFDNFSDQVMEIGAIGLGFVSAILLVTQPLALLGVLVAVIVFGRSLLVSQYEHAARIDSKTGLAAAGRWHEFAGEMLARSRHGHTRMALLMIDLDHFKTINDTYGHPFGDTVLKSVAEELRGVVRERDACGRWGGEEFTVLLSDVDTEQDVHHVAERIRLRIQSVVLEAPDTGEPITVTTSVGGVLYDPEETATVDELLLAADSALYEAKNNGRNTVRLRSISGSQLMPDEGTETPPAMPDTATDAEPDMIRGRDGE